MLDRFHVPEKNAVRVSEPILRVAIELVFTKMGLSQDNASLSADVLMYADLH